MKRIRTNLYVFVTVVITLSVLRAIDGYPLLLSSDHLGFIAWFGAAMTAMTLAELLWTSLRNRTRKD